MRESQEKIALIKDLSSDLLPHIDNWNLVAVFGKHLLVRLVTDLQQDEELPSVHER